MSIHKSLKVASRLTKIRSVLKRDERIELMMSQDRWSEGMSVTGLPKTKIPKVGLVKKKKEKKVEEDPKDKKKGGKAAPAAAAAAKAPAAGAKAPAAGAKAAAPAAKAPAAKKK